MVIRAYAKINLTLDIVGKREDGYHNIDSVFQSVGLFDTVKVEKSDKILVVCDGVEEEKNTAFAAAHEFFGFTGISGGAKIEIEKRIPMLSGLGGGSADAAAVIIALDRIYKTNLKKQELVTIAMSCGADVPFCISGGTARVSGIGEKITEMPEISGLWAVIVKHGEKKSTADMYKKIDNITDIKLYTEEFVKHALNGEKEMAISGVGNAFSAVFDDDGVLKILSELKPIGAALSGSGPACFAVFRCEMEAKAAAQKLTDSGFSPYTVPFVNSGNAVIE